MSIWPKRHAQAFAEANSGNLRTPDTTSSSVVGSSRTSDTDLSNGRVLESALRFDPHLRKILVAFYGTAMLVVVLASNTRLVQLVSADRTVLNWLVLAAGFLVAGVLLFPWPRFHRNLLLAPVLIGMNLVALIVYLSGGWSSPLSILYLFLVVFCAIYFASGPATLCIGFVLLVSLSPQLYAPDATRLMEHLVIDAPVYLALAFASGYVRRCMLREHEIILQRVREIEDRFQQEASVDRLTRIFNRAHFEARLREEYERTWRLDGNFVVVFLDLDDFKRVNDTYGHRIGDEALKLVARTLQSNAREIDVVARYGGDEFAILMPGTSPSGVRSFFERIRTEVAERSRLVLGFTIRLSAGMTKFPYDTSEPLYLLEAADAAMYEAKRRGKDRMFVAVPRSTNSETHRVSLPTSSEEG